MRCRSGRGVGCLSGTRDMHVTEVVSTSHSGHIALFTERISRRPSSRSNRRPRWFFSPCGAMTLRDTSLYVRVYAITERVGVHICFLRTFSELLSREEGGAWGKGGITRPWSYLGARPVRAYCVATLTRTKMPPFTEGEGSPLPSSTPRANGVRAQGPPPPALARAAQALLGGVRFIPPATEKGPALVPCRGDCIALDITCGYDSLDPKAFAAAMRDRAGPINGPRGKNLHALRESRLVAATDHTARPASLPKSTDHGPTSADPRRSDGTPRHRRSAVDCLDRGPPRSPRTRQLARTALAIDSWETRGEPRWAAGAVSGKPRTRWNHRPTGARSSRYRLRSLPPSQAQPKP